MKIFYKTAATATGGRSGTSTLNDGSFSVQMVRPDSDEDGVNPEQLFALGYAACFDSAMEITAKQLKLNAKGAKTSIEVGIGQRSGGGYGLDLDITAHLLGMAREDAQRLVEATHQLCPYSNAIRGNIDVRLHIETEGN
ncbi:MULTISPECIES: organic hydroperoxide resistance protein [Gammaproteobacteria]|jgi:Ohr subfamily peroxiredoxin|uniref:Peroxiredoxin, Ohr subfamily n=4 Tax=Gammaproteobacteria TaxID=1236 RepID=D1P3H0_9GAMM|nr:MULTISPECIES: organic hydroperoxide resistance protein [Gammaproteobacteria]EAQ0367028.1 organic hydroperoxide resistance protein [Salmonella enterica]EFB72086.1 peroxiredoxin, Ohr subfamily [Providencia rustigianii DSM 4541]HDS3816856.1 organic hydroperoxide resistance protein [Morganella morganii subsp. morganii]EAV1793715.1 organic hydroperoxide resistance protein [Salmonella enterica]EJD6329431.1 organic hydroperoxide resistance protein [Proteus mirabilis]|tara:strand:+ start:8275 stop:8691 length:417 start_codon:yes stop_codon:yes gene_type:complete